MSTTKRKSLGKDVEPSTSKKVTIQEVAQLAGVSGATVSYILNGSRNGKSRASEATRQRVRAAAEELGYIPNAVARTLQRQQTNCVCLMVPKMTPESMALSRHMQTIADKKGYQVLISVAGTKERELQIFYKLQKGLADGAMIFDAQFLDEDYFRQLAQSGIALAVVDNNVTPDNFDLIQHNIDEICQQAVEMLVQKGHMRFSVLGNMSESSDMTKIKRYLNLIQAHGIEVDYQYIKGEIRTEKDAYNVVQEFSELDNPPTAILAVSDQVAIGALLGAQHAGINIPTKLAILGMGNTPETAVTSPSLSTIGSKSVDYDQLIDLVFSRIDNKSVLDSRIASYEYKLILREST